VICGDILKGNILLKLCTGPHIKPPFISCFSGVRVFYVVLVGFVCFMLFNYMSSRLYS